MKQIKFLILFILISLVGTSCSKHTLNYTDRKSNAYASFETTCIKASGDGTQTLRAWGIGSSEANAIEQAKKNAVRDVIFKGIKGQGACNKDPLIFEVNARERYEEYFDPFFSDGGEYKKFVREVKAGNASRIKIDGQSVSNYGVIVIVDRPALRRQLIKDGVITK